MDLFLARRMAEELLDKWDCGHYSFAWIHTKKACGRCSYTKMELQLSTHHVRLNDEETIRDTILHEIAHILTPGHGHDSVWKEACRRIGAKPERLAHGVKAPSKNWAWTCRMCQIVQPCWYRKPRRNLDRAYCPDCGKKSKGMIGLVKL